MGHQRIARRPAPRYTRYQLYIAATDVTELVTTAGGWMCDRIQAGWDVTVALAEPCDLRALQILGVTSTVSVQGFESISHPGEVLAAIAFTSDTFDRDELLRSTVRNVLDHEATEVIIWGTDVPSELNGRVHRLQYQLSGAAHAFKAHAVAATTSPAARICPTEDLYTSAPMDDGSGTGDTHLVVKQAGGAGA